MAQQQQQQQLCKKKRKENMNQKVENGAGDYRKGMPHPWIVNIISGFMELRLSALGTRRSAVLVKWC